ncbi:MAG TPA: GxxExxY protein [Thermodesulfobacteriota bacterium]|jgi:hypothetical protein|nr:GxxExxY protein [Thermodesulfobacteriota bacterium]
MGETDSITEQIIGCSFEVHRELGPGFNERIYHNALRLSFDQKGLQYETEKEFEVSYLNKKIGSFRADIVVEGEIKASGLHVGLLINFGNKSCQVKRVALKSV